MIDELVWSNQMVKSLFSHSNSFMLKVGWSLDLASLLFLISRNHAEFVIRVELRPHARLRLIGLMLELFRFNDNLHILLLSPVKLTSKFTAQHQTSVLCRFHGDSRWGLTAYQVECTSNESLGSSCHGIAVAPRRSAPFLLLSFIGKSTPLVQLNSHFNRVALCFQILSVMYWGLSPKLWSCFLICLYVKKMVW